MAKLFGPVSPTIQRLDSSDLLKPDLQLFFEVALPSPHDYRSWLSRHPDDRQVLATLRDEAKSKVEAPREERHSMRCC